jgi:hypothetical protein
MPRVPGVIGLNGERIILPESESPARLSLFLGELEKACGGPDGVVFLATATPENIYNVIAKCAKIERVKAVVSVVDQHMVALPVAKSFPEQMYNTAKFKRIHEGILPLLMDPVRMRAVMQIKELAAFFGRKGISREALSERTLEYAPFEKSPNPAETPVLGEKQLALIHAIREFMVQDRATLVCHR